VCVGCVCGGGGGCGGGGRVGGGRGGGGGGGGGGGRGEGGGRGGGGGEGEGREWGGLTKERDHCSTAVEELFCWNTTVFQQDQILKSDCWKEADSTSNILT